LFYPSNLTNIRINRVSTVRAAIELKSVFDQIAAAEKNGNLTPEARRKLEESAAEKGLQTLFKGAKLEIESVLREVCDRLLTPTPPSHEMLKTAMVGGQVHPVTKEKIFLRAIALEIMGEAFMAVRKDPDGEEVGEGYVKVDVKR
jgi:hypothetical protein